MAGLYARGEAVLRQAADLRPQYAPVHYELGRVFLAQGKNELARLAFDRYLTLDPNSEQRSAVEAALLQLGPKRGK